MVIFKVSDEMQMFLAATMCLPTTGFLFTKNGRHVRFGLCTERWEEEQAVTREQAGHTMELGLPHRKQAEGLVPMFTN